MKKVLHFIYADAFSGLENVAVQIIKNLPPDWEGYYVAPPGMGVKCAESMGIKTVVCDTHRISEIKRVIKEQNPDVIHAHDPHMSLNLALIGKPFVSHLHCNCPWLGSVCPNSLALAFSCKKAKSILCVSKSIEDEFVFRKYMKGKNVILLNCVDGKRILSMAGSSGDKKYDLCFVGRLTELKQPKKFVELVSLLKADFESIKSVVVGDGELRGEVEKTAESMGLKSNIDFVGFDTNPYKYMNESKIGVLTSSSEGFGLVAVEAMILGLPFVAFPVGGIPDIVTEETGLLCKDISQMKEEISRLLSDREYYNKKSENAKKSCARFTDMDAYIEKIIEAYDKAGICKKSQ